MARLRSDIFVSAYIRRCEIDGVFAVLRRRGAAEAGAIIVRIDRLDGTCALYGPAPKSLAEDDGVRRFVRMHVSDTIDPPAAEERIARELKFDSDLWIVEVDDRAGTPRLDLAED